MRMEQLYLRQTNETSLQNEMKTLDYYVFHQFCFLHLKSIIRDVAERDDEVGWTKCFKLIGFSGANC